jgi:hypothetical protein
MKYTRSIIFVILLHFPLSSILSVHTVLLKQGKSIKGIVSSQNVDHVEVISQEGKHLIIPKKSVLKVIYRDLAEEDEQNIRKQEEAKREADKMKLMELRKQEILAKKRESSDSPSKPNDDSGQTFKRNSSIRDAFVLGSTSSNQTITLASFGQKCKIYSEHPEYFWMFGAFRFNEPNLSELLPQNNAPLRITHTSTYKDIAFTMLGGFLVTVTRKTLVIETCEGQGYKLISDTELDQIKNSAISDLKTQQEIESLQDKVELELLEKDLQELEKNRKGK